jgi:hypothetical protein
MYRPIERRMEISPGSFVRDYVANNRPVVIQSIALAEACRWTPGSLKARFGDRRVTAETDEELFYTRQKRPMTLAELVDSVASGSLDYRLREYDFLDRIPELKLEFQAAYSTQAFLGAAVRLHGIYIAPRGNQSAFHHDFADNNLNVQIYGRKRFILAPPRCYPLLQVREFGFSPIDPFDPGAHARPEVAELVPHLIEAVLAPGETIYIPKYWWHVIRAEDVSINVVSLTREGGMSAWRATSGVDSLPRAALLSQVSQIGRSVAAALQVYRRRLRPQHHSSRPTHGRF